MEASWEEIAAEERRSARLARLEDDQEEARERKRNLDKLKKRKLN